MAKLNRLLNPSSMLGKFLIVAIAFALIGGIYAAFQSFAVAPPIASLEAETMLVAHGVDGPIAAAPINDSSASGGRAMQFTANGELYQTFNLPKKANVVKIYVHDTSVKVSGTKKKGACSTASLVQLYLDDKALTHQFKVVNPSWKVRGQFEGRAVDSGEHMLKVFYQHDTVDPSCAPQLAIDKIDFYFRPSPPPSPQDQAALPPQYVTESNGVTPDAPYGNPATDIPPGDQAYMTPGETIYTEANQNNCHPGNQCSN